MIEEPLVIGELPQYKVLPELFFPDESQLPPDDLTDAARYRGFVFDFGFSPGSASVAARDVAEVTLQFDSDVLIWAISQQGDQVASGYRVRVAHDVVSAGAQREMFNKPQLGANIGGSAGKPLLLKETYLIGAGDSVLVEVRNMAAVAQKIQMLLHGAELAYSGAPALQTGGLRRSRRRE